MIPAMEKAIKKERAAWREVENRLAFLAEIVGRSDAESVSMASKNLVEALKEHDEAYQERISAQLGPAA